MPFLVIIFILLFIIHSIGKFILVSTVILFISFMVVFPIYMICREQKKSNPHIELNEIKNEKILEPEHKITSIKHESCAEKSKKESHNKIIGIVNKHKINLQIMHNKLVKVNQYGRLVDNGWNKEIEFFIRTEVKPELSYYDRIYLNENIHNLFDYINEIVSEKQDIDVISPYEYEQYCADVFINHGWNAVVTPGSGDQGADIIAEKNNKRIAIQCKMYSAPVGNSAVQEVFSAKRYYNASDALVITTIGYTKSAFDLAKKTNVYLITDKSIPDFISSFNT